MATALLWLQSTGHVAGVAEDMDFKFYFNRNLDFKKKMRKIVYATLFS